MTKLTDILYEILLEKKKKRDRCLRIADRRYDTPSAYKSGAVVRCRQGDIWKDLKEGKQVGTLYHYTSAEGLKNILKTGQLKTSEENYLGHELHYISFTRNKNFHKKGSKFGVQTEYRIALDGDKLSNKYKIRPFSYIPGWDIKDSWELDWLDDEPESVRRDFFNATGDYDEQEERIFFKNQNSGIGNIKNYILAVDKVEALQEDTTPSAEQRIDELPKGKLFDDAKNIESIFNRSKHSWSEVIELFEKNKSKEQYVNIEDIHITQPNIQSNKVKHIITNSKEIPAINVVEFPDGEKVIYDGHHRLVANWALGNEKIKTNLVQVENLEEAESLHKWFKRSGPKGKGKGWVDCNAPDGDGGYKSCGRKEGEKRSKYPACRPTAAQCKAKGKGKTWGKTK